MCNELVIEGIIRKRSVEGTLNRCTSMYIPHVNPSYPTSISVLLSILHSTLITSASCLIITTLNQVSHTCLSLKQTIQLRNQCTLFTWNAGVKPISKASSALKKFFPRDEDDIDLALDDRPSSAALEMSIPTTATRSPASWCNSHDSRKDGTHAGKLSSS